MNPALNAPHSSTTRYPAAGLAHLETARRRLLLMVMPGAVLAVLVAAIAVANPNFLRAGSIWTVLDSAVPILILATGAMLVGTLLDGVLKKKDS